MTLSSRCAEWGISLTTSDKIKDLKKRLKIKEKTLSLHSTISIYLLVFIAGILIIVWFFQIFTLGFYYEMSTKIKIRKMANAISLAFDENYPLSVRDVIEDLAYNNTAAIVIADLNGNAVVTADFMGGYSALTKDGGFNLFRYSSDVLNSSSGHFMFETTNERFGTTEYLYGVRLHDHYITFINTSIEPIGPAVEILKEQYVFISLLTFLLAIFISTALARRLSRPFKQITQGAEALASGDYTTHFEGGGYTEVDELADALNFAASEILKVDSLRNDLIANVSHDLRTPLTMIKAYAEMIRDLSGNNPEKREEHLSVIIDESDRLSELVNNLLELSKLQNGAIELDRRQFSVQEFISSVLARYQVLSEREGYKFEVELDEDVICFGDESRLAQVLYNFINNAVNYSGESRRIIVRQKNLKETVRIEVVDFGVGIARERLPQIFDRYYRDERTKRDVIGSGLGLSIVKEIMRMHGLRFGAQSELGKGSTFWFEIQKMPSED